eukprot:4540065-Prymnesium_polylepis.1
MARQRTYSETTLAKRLVSMRGGAGIRLCSERAVGHAPPTSLVFGGPPWREGSVGHTGAQLGEPV